MQKRGVKLYEDQHDSRLYFENSTVTQQTSSPYTKLQLDTIVGKLGKLDDAQI